MYRYYLLIVGTLFIQSIGCGQDHAVDTIFVSAQNPTYLLFDEKVELIDLGIQDYYVKPAENSVFLKAKTPQSNVTTILVKYGEKYFHSLVAYDSFPEKTIYDLRMKLPNPGYVLTDQEIKERAEEQEQEEMKQRVKVHLEDFKRREPKYKTFAVMSDRILIAALDIMNDKDATYIWFKIDNQGSVAYELKEVRFDIVDKKKKSTLKSISPVLDIDLKPVTGKSAENLFIALPATGMHKDNYLKISFYEKGTRKIALYIEGADILKADVY